MSSARAHLFVSYSHKDSRFLSELQAHLALVVRDHLVDLWEDTRIEAGDNWKREIESALESARVAICLVSKDFWASKFIVEIEVPELLARASSHELEIIPVIVGRCAFDTSPFSDIQAINDPQVPLQAMTPDKRNKVWVRLFNRIQDIMNTKPAQKAKVRSVPLASDVLLQTASPNMRSSPVDTLLKCGAQFNAQGRFSEAQQILKHAVKIVPRHYAAWFELATALSGAGKDAEATDAFIHAAQIDAQMHEQKDSADFGLMELPGYAEVSVIAGRGVGIYAHGLGEKPDDVLVLSKNGTATHVDTLSGRTFGVESSASEPYWVAMAIKADRRERPYRFVSLFAPGERVNLSFEWHGHHPPPGMHWKRSLEQLDALHEARLIYIPPRGAPRYIHYRDETSNASR